MTMPGPSTAAAISPSLALTVNLPSTWKEVAVSACDHSWAWEHSWPLWSFRKEGFDFVSGLDLLRAAEVLPVKPMRIGTAQELAEKTPVVVAGSGGIEAAQPAVVGRPAERGRMLG
jgi:hypothetical protein